MALRDHKEIYRSNSLLFGDILTRNERTREVLARAEVVADSDLPILIVGENGTGKTLLAQAIHNASSRRAGPFVAFNASAITETLLEAELFGSEKGSYTGADRQRRGKFEIAHGGTLFLDEIGDMSQPAQAKILRAVEYGEIERVGGEETIAVDVRIISATNKNVEKLIESGVFREDLYYRINGVELEIPPLRERPEDIELLIEHFVGTYAAKLGKNVTGVSSVAMSCLLNHDWPGNIRQLDQVIKRGVTLAQHEQIWLEDMSIKIQMGDPQSAAETENGDLSLATMEKKHIERVLSVTAGNKKRACELLGVARTTLDRKIRQFGIDAIG